MYLKCDNVTFTNYGIPYPGTNKDKTFCASRDS